MGADELNAGLAAHLVRAGDPPRNPTGKSSPELRSINRDIKALFFRKADEACDLPRHTHHTWMEAQVDTTWMLAIAGDKDARKDLFNRMFGRVPLGLEAQLTLRKEPLADLTDAELAERGLMLLATIKRLRAGEPTASDTSDDEDAVILESGADGYDENDPESPDRDCQSPSPSAERRRT